FLGIQEFALCNANVSENKEYNDIYKAFVRSIMLPEDYLTRMYDSDFARHFYTDAELKDFRSRWTTRSTEQALAPCGVGPPAARDCDARVAGHLSVEGSHNSERVKHAPQVQ